MAVFTLEMNNQSLEIIRLLQFLSWYEFETDKLINR